MAISTPSHSVNYHHENNLVDPERSITDDIQNLHSVEPNDLIDALPHGIASNDLLSILELTLGEEMNLKKQNINLRMKNSNEECNDRINRSNFKKKYYHIDEPNRRFFAIGTMYPLAQFNDTGSAQKLRYLCVAGNDDSYG
jgi:hypothetical protein